MGSSMTNPLFTNVIYSFVWLVCFSHLGYSLFISNRTHLNDVINRSNIRPPQCSDKYLVIDGHTMCLGNIIPSRLPSTEETKLIENKHNIIRSAVTPPAADMLEIKYNKGLEIEAHLWAEHCQLEHDDIHARLKPGHFHVGQNMAIIPNRQVSWETVLDLWASEKINFTYGQASTDITIVGNYTQMVWAETSVVGCAMANCSGIYFYVCNYATKMNESSLATPYTLSVSGQSCDQCPRYCTDDQNSTNLTVLPNLCDCGGVICQNGGRLNLDTCTCECLTVSHFYVDLICTLQCEDNGDHPDCGRGGLTKSSCLSSLTTPFKCPWMCDICPYASKHYTGGSLVGPTPTSKQATPTTSSLSQLFTNKNVTSLSSSFYPFFGLTNLEFYLALALILVTVLFTLIIFLIVHRVTQNDRHARRIRHNSYKTDKAEN